MSKTLAASAKRSRAPEHPGPIRINGIQFMGVRDAKKLTAIFAEIEENERTAEKLLSKIAIAYYDAGNIIAAALREWKTSSPIPSTKSFAKESGFPERRITLALKIFRWFENNSEMLKGISLRDALKLIAPPPPAGEDGYNRVDLGGDPGQMKLDFGELFEVPANANSSLQNYRTVADLLTEIIVVRRDKDNRLISKRFMQFCEDIPQSPALRAAYKTMAYKTQAAVEDYLSAVEQEEE